MPKPSPANEFYDFLADEAIANLIANQELTDMFFEGTLYFHSECVMTIRKVGLAHFPMRFERI